KELRQIWTKTWNIEPHARVGRNMLEKSLAFKKQNPMTLEQETQLNQLIKKYKRNPKYFDENCALKPGTKLVRNWKGKHHSVLVKTDGFEYQNTIYTSLSQIANDITGSRWNGYLFFGLKKSS
ncbi:MAG: DUF2924 domain-containing protein, partial [Pseudomonadota bacterium]